MAQENEEKLKLRQEKYKVRYEQFKSPLTKEEIEEGNELIIRYLGYIYKYKGTEDYSDIGGMYTYITYYSKIPLEFKYIHDDLDMPRGEDLITKNDHNQYIIVCDEEFSYDAQHLPFGLQYHKDWNLLIPVAKHIFDNDTEDLGKDEFWTRDYIWYCTSYWDINILFKSIIKYLKLIK